MPDRGSNNLLILRNLRQMLESLPTEVRGQSRFVIRRLYVSSAMQMICWELEEHQNTLGLISPADARTSPYALSLWHDFQQSIGDVTNEATSVLSNDYWPGPEPGQPGGPRRRRTKPQKPSQRS